MNRKLIHWLGLTGTIALLSYTAAVVFSPLAFPGYNWMAQAVSDLSAESAPSRTLWIWKHSIRDLSADCMVIGTSAIIDTEIDGAVGMNSGIFNNPFMIWGRYRKKLFRYFLPVSFQFHHTQMDGAHAGKFLSNLQKEINNIG